MNIKYPRELQRRFEQAVVQGKYAEGEVMTVDDLASKLQITPAEMMPVILTAYRKGLVDKVAQEVGAFRILGLPTTKFASVFTHTAKSGFKPRSLVRNVEVEPATPVVAEKLDVEVDSPVYRMCERGSRTSKLWPIKPTICLLRSVPDWNTTTSPDIRFKNYLRKNTRLFSSR